MQRSRIHGLATVPANDTFRSYVLYLVVTSDAQLVAVIAAVQASERRKLRTERRNYGTRARVVPLHLAEPFTHFGADLIRCQKNPY
jgi:hypothetical protein